MDEILEALEYGSYGNDLTADDFYSFESLCDAYLEETNEPSEEDIQRKKEVRDKIIKGIAAATAILSVIAVLTVQIKKAVKDKQMTHTEGAKIEKMYAKLGAQVKKKELQLEAYRKKMYMTKAEADNAKKISTELCELKDKQADWALAGSLSKNPQKLYQNKLKNNKTELLNTMAWINTHTKLESVGMYDTLVDAICEKFSNDEITADDAVLLIERAADKYL